MSPDLDTLVSIGWGVTVQQCNSATVQQCNSSTVQQCSSAPVQKCTSATVQQFNSSTVQRERHLPTLASSPFGELCRTVLFIIFGCDLGDNTCVDLGLRMLDFSRYPPCRKEEFASCTFG